MHHSLFAAFAALCFCLRYASGAGITMSVDIHSRAGSKEHLELLSKHQKLKSSGAGDLQAELTVLNNHLSTVKVAVGGQEMNFVLDTGSTNFWVTSSTCKSDTCKSHKQYDPSKSPDHKKLSDTEVDISFGTGSYTGVLYQDTITIGGKDGTRLNNQPFLLGVELRGYVFNTPDFSGIFGLGFRSLAYKKHLPVFDHLVDIGAITHNQFYFYCPDSVSKEHYFVMGQPDGFEDHYSKNWPTPCDPEPLQELTVNDPYYWSVDLDDVLLGGVSIFSSKPKLRKEACGGPNKKCKLAFDSGAALNTVPGVAYKEMLSISNGHCTNKMPVGSLTYVIAGRNYTFDPSEYMENFNDNKDGCHALLLQDLDVKNEHGPLFLAGYHFHKKFLVIYRKNSDSSGGKIILGRAANSKDSDSGAACSRESPNLLQAGLRNHVREKLFE